MINKLSLLNIFIAGTCLKLLLFVGYHSTDFEVHRNWLAITHNLPTNQWYIEHTSQWTLDYPPFFAWFEWLLTKFVPDVVKNDGIFYLVELGNYGMPTISYQRLTVIVSEIVLFASLQWYINTSTKNERLRSFVIAASIVLSPGLLIIDHIHFQYNGFMYGIMIFSIVAARNNQLLLSGTLFAVLLCFKHIYLYLAPAYFVYLLRVYVLTAKSIFAIQFTNAVKLGCTVVGIFFVAFYPFIYFGQLSNVMERLFPFSRGLTHAYWAPNVWALYSFGDRVLTTVLKISLSSSTRGLVGDVKFGVLPEVQPKLTFFLTLFYQVLALIPLFIYPTFDRFLASLTLCGYSSFLFGWHVHEKAILLIIFPFSFLILKDRRLYSSFMPLAVAGYISLFPLIFTSAETLLKSFYTFVWLVMFFYSFNHLVTVGTFKKRVFLLDRVILIYLVGFVPLLVFTSIILSYSFKNYQFLGLMAISVYCSIGVIGSWTGFSWLYFFDDELWRPLEGQQKDE